LVGCAAPGHQAAQPAELAAHPSPVTVDGIRIAFHVHGHGPIVFAHSGGPGMEWSYLRMPEVEKFATVVYLEPPGTGASGPMTWPGGYSVDNYVKAADGVRAALGIDKIVLLGHSHGGFVAQSYALAHPDHLRGLILYDTSPTVGAEWQNDVESNLHWFEHEPWYPEAAKGLAAEDSMRTDDQATENFKRELPLYFADWTARAQEFEVLRAQVRMWVAPGRSANDPSAPADVGLAPAFDVVARLHEIATPTLILVGTKDFVCSPRMADMLHAGIPGSKLAVLPHSGHMGHIEEPGAHASAIREFLATLP
jgi:proline iminopeptidase